MSVTGIAMIVIPVSESRTVHCSKIPKWCCEQGFLAIILMLNAKKSISSHQLGRDWGINHETARYMQTRIRCAMDSEDGFILRGIVEADETYVGGKPRKGNKLDDDHKPTGPGARRRYP